MENKTCDKCSAPLCPESDKTLSDVFYPSEEICSRHNDGFIKIQKKIAKKTKYLDRYYTIEMLKKNCVIGSGIKGIDPDRDEELQLQIWMKNHKTRQILSDEERQKKSDAFRARIGRRDALR